MSKKSHHKTSKIRIPIKQNAKTVMMGDIELTIPVLSIYHTKFFNDIKADNFYEVIGPLIDKIYKNPTKSQFSFIIIKLLEHNKALKTITEYDGETFDLSDIQLSSKTKFIVDDVEYEFKPLMPEDDYETPLQLLSNNLIGDKVDFSARGITFEFMKVYYEYNRDVYVVGDKGSILEGLGVIIDYFATEE